VPHHRRLTSHKRTLRVVNVHRDPARIPVGRPLLQQPELLLPLRVERAVVTALDCRYEFLLAHAFGLNRRTLNRLARALDLAEPIVEQHVLHGAQRPVGLVWVAGHMEGEGSVAGVENLLLNVHELGPRLRRAHADLFKDVPVVEDRRSDEPGRQNVHVAVGGGSRVQNALQEDVLPPICALNVRVWFLQVGHEVCKPPAVRVAVHFAEEHGSDVRTVGREVLRCDPGQELVAVGNLREHFEDHVGMQLPVLLDDRIQVDRRIPAVGRQAFARRELAHVIGGAPPRHRESLILPASRWPLRFQRAA